MDELLLTARQLCIEDGTAEKFAQHFEVTRSLKRTGTPETSLLPLIGPYLAENF